MDWPHLEGTYWLCYKESLEMDSPRQTEKGMPKKHLWVMFRLRQRIGAAPGPHSKDYPRTGGGEGGRSLLAYAPGGDKGITTNNCYVRRLQDTGCYVYSTKVLALLYHFIYTDYPLKLIMSWLIIEWIFLSTGIDLRPFQYMWNPLMTHLILMNSRNQNWIQVLKCFDFWIYSSYINLKK